MKYVVILIIVDILYLSGKFIWFLAKHGQEDYFQTWIYVANLDKVHKKILMFLCGLILRHPISKTEWGYGGGDYADRWCRWCNKQIRVPKESVYFTHPQAKGLMTEVTQETTNE